MPPQPPPPPLLLLLLVVVVGLAPAVVHFPRPDELYMTAASPVEVGRNSINSNSIDAMELRDAHFIDLAGRGDGLPALLAAIGSTPTTSARISSTSLAATRCSMIQVTPDSDRTEGGIILVNLRICISLARMRWFNIYIRVLRITIIFVNT
jgi:hypothetical protein